MYLLVYSSNEDPVVQSLNCSFKDLGEPLVLVSLEKLLNDVEIDDEIVEGKTTLNWTLPDGMTVSNRENVKLINRVLTIPECLFEDFHPEDREYAKNEFCAYLMFSLENFKHSTAKPGYLGMAGNQYPLPYQWEQVRKTIPSIKTPPYYVGPFEGFPFNLDKEEVVQSSIFNFRYWKSSDKISRPKPNENLFSFVKPKGQPYFCFVCGGEVLVARADENKSDCPDCLVRLSQTSKEVVSLFSQKIAEILFFVDRGDITFGMSTNTLFGISKNSSFDSFLCQGLKEIFREGVC